MLGRRGMLLNRSVEVFGESVVASGRIDGRNGSTHGFSVNRISHKCGHSRDLSFWRPSTPAFVHEIERLEGADKVLISSPMCNFSIPYRLKHYLDLVCQPGLSFQQILQRGALMLG